MPVPRRGFGGTKKGRVLQGLRYVKGCPSAEVTFLSSSGGDRHCVTGMASGRVGPTNVKAVRLSSPGKTSKVPSDDVTY